VRTFFSIILLFLVFESKASVQLYGIGATGFAKATETNSGNTFSHTNSFFIGHFGYGGGARLGFDLANVTLGAVGELAWVGNSFDRKQTGVVNDSTYRYESIRTILGLSTALNLGPMKVVGEYYPSVQNTVSYSDDKSQNPFRKNDKLKATGYGLGIGYSFASGFNMAVLYRILTYKNVEMNGTAVTLPNSQYTEFVFNEVTFGPTYSF